MELDIILMLFLAVVAVVGVGAFWYLAKERK
ncbi:hypothetical protein T36_2133 [Helicobacter cinaedi]|uniref:Uncharacterized protein n=1 Tax=Helicobacter cinaedi TaxID=213 RepID=A0A377JWK5_9HELI|nr:hypothetical protein T36_2133 [Helicobacter cinaedi]BDB67512.1 hypothetical protein Hc94105_1735 [Helicobacter cinaedi]STP11839.1 Uncharacterised protein [Helicobacter cinaedi]STP13714.1 Uncharacterised protein [Helicobacter cinaedi]